MLRVSFKLILLELVLHVLLNLVLVVATDETVICLLLVELVDNWSLSTVVDGLDSSCLEVNCSSLDFVDRIPVVCYQLTIWDVRKLLDESLRVLVCVPVHY